MRWLLAGAVAVAVIGSTSGAGPQEPHAGSMARYRARLKKLEAQVRAQQEVLDQLVRNQGPLLFVQPAQEPWLVPTPEPSVVPVPEPAPYVFTPQAVDRCLVHVDSAAIDRHFVVNAPERDPQMIVVPRVVGLPAGSWPYGLRRP
jgi:hypothetical protein